MKTLLLIAAAMMVVGCGADDRNIDKLHLQCHKDPEQDFENCTIDGSDQTIQTLN